MAFSPQTRGQGPPLPSLIASVSDHYPSHHQDMSLGKSFARSIPSNNGARVVAPPALPPPPFPFGNPNQHPDDMPRRPREYSNSHHSFSSGYGSISSSLADDRPRYQKSQVGNHLDDRDEGYSSWSSSGRSQESFPTKFGILHNSFQFQSPADGDFMKRKLPSNPFPKSEPSCSLLGSSAIDLYPRRLPQLNIPLHMHPRGLEGPSRLSEIPVFSAPSPVSATFPRLTVSSRSSLDMSNADRSPPARSARNSSDDASMQSAFDYNNIDDMELDDGPSPKRSHVDDAYMGGGQKRRAPGSSPRDDVAHYLGAYREPGSRGSPTPRLMTTSTSSLHKPQVSRADSYTSTATMTTTHSSFGRCSPGGYSAGGTSPLPSTSPHPAPLALNRSPRASMSAKGQPSHVRVISASSTIRKAPETQKTAAGTAKSNYMICDCCPKKPRKFESQVELEAHQAEKQYECQYCGNRFKNKNEMERHTNSLHLRPHSWSCSNLENAECAFHESQVRPGEADVCGYCGEEFTRSGPATNRAGAYSVTNEDWDIRTKHLHDHHKFRECNSTKKFFRADHFRQHLKHSHGGTSGKWTNLLESACMAGEPPPTPR